MGPVIEKKETTYVVLTGNPNCGKMSIFELRMANVEKNSIAMTTTTTVMGFRKAL